jgi:hypothetical protein
MFTILLHYLYYPVVAVLENTRYLFLNRYGALTDKEKMQRFFNVTAGYHCVLKV